MEGACVGTRAPPHPRSSVAQPSPRRASGSAVGGPYAGFGGAGPGGGGGGSHSRAGSLSAASPKHPLPVLPTSPALRSPHQPAGDHSHQHQHQHQHHGLHLASPPPLPPSLPLRSSDERERGSSGALAARNVLLETENAGLRQEQAEMHRAFADREAALVGEVDEMRGALAALEQHMLVAEGRFTGLMEAARKEWAAEAAMGGRAEAARLTASLMEMKASEKLLADQDVEIERLKSMMGAHDSDILKANAAYKEKLAKAEYAKAAAEAEATQLASALESLQNILKEQANFKSDMQEKLQSACQDIANRDKVLSGVQEQLDESNRRECEREQEINLEREKLASELKVIGAKSLEEVRRAAALEKSRADEAVHDAVMREAEYRDRISSLQAENSSLTRQVAEHKAVAESCQAQIASTDAERDKDLRALQDELESKKKELEVAKREIENYWQTYGKVTTQGRQQSSGRAGKSR